MHGFGIARRIEQVSRGRLQSESRVPAHGVPAAGARGLAGFRVAQTENSRRAKFYWLTRSGRKQLEVEMVNWNRRASAIARLLKVEG